MTENEIRQVAANAAGIAGHTFETLPPYTRVRWIAEVTAAINGGQDETTVGQAARRALREYNQAQTAQPEAEATTVMAKLKAAIKPKK
jgi:hypothetical protein